MVCVTPASVLLVTRYASPANHREMMSAAVRTIKQIPNRIMRRGLIAVLDPAPHR